MAGITAGRRMWDQSQKSPQHAFPTYDSGKTTVFKLLGQLPRRLPDFLHWERGLAFVIRQFRACGQSNRISPGDFCDSESQILLEFRAEFRQYYGSASAQIPFYRSEYG